MNLLNRIAGGGDYYWDGECEMVAPLIYPPSKIPGICKKIKKMEWIFMIGIHGGSGICYLGARRLYGGPGTNKPPHRPSCVDRGRTHSSMCSRCRRK